VFLPEGVGRDRQWGPEDLPQLLLRPCWLLHPATLRRCGQQLPRQLLGLLRGEPDAHLAACPDPDAHAETGAWTAEPHAGAHAETGVLFPGATAGLAELSTGERNSECWRQLRRAELCSQPGTLEV